ncbi:RNA polymerase [Pteropox virus]|uniref:DNA-directed RNA polymerase 19 kDa subunit n=1 Tax=Pteropox virus TaxID=1873698 RepID=A0A1B1MRK1_9POXV|nr:RNA polymerase [Pteropox virus]ANS71183.1 RNA polymerase [Pteropox virus]
MATSLDDDVDIESDYESSEYEKEDDEKEDEDDEFSDSDVEKSLDMTSELADKSSLKFKSPETVPSINVQDTVQQSNKISLIKKRYTRRMSLFELTGILAESINLLQRGRLPLVEGLSGSTLQKNLLQVAIQEIRDKTCPVIIKKNGEYLSVNDFDESALEHHLTFITKIWKQQNRY